MFHRIMRRTVATLATTAILASFVNAQDAPDADQVVASVNGTDITLGHVIALRASLPAQYAQLPAERLYRGILDQLIQQTLLMQAHSGDLSKFNQVVIENERRALFAGEIIQDVMGGDLDEAKIQAAYDETYAGAEQETEYRAAHILVATLDEANALTEELSGGADFAELAKERSTGPSGPNGGDLGWFGAGVMVESFFNAVTELQPGDVSNPVETQFGWHVIKLLETRQTELPTLDAVREQLEAGLRQKAFDEYLAELEKTANIERAEETEIDPENINNIELLEN